jgi:hypothetical protein
MDNDLKKKKRYSRRAKQNKNVKIKNKNGEFEIVLNKSVLKGYSQKKSKPSIIINDYENAKNEVVEDTHNTQNNNPLTAFTTFNKQLTDPTTASPVTQTNTSLKKNLLLFSPSKDEEFHSQHNLHSTKNKLIIENPFFAEKHNPETNKEMKLISPLNFYNNRNHMIFPLGSTTNKSFNINFDTIINENNAGKESTKQGQVLNSSNVFSTLHNLGNVASPKQSDYINNVNNLNKLLFETNNIPYYMNHHINQNNYFNFNLYHNPSHDNNIFDDTKDSQSQSKDALKSRKKSMPNLDIDSIKTSNTNQIFNECLMNSYNMYNSDSHHKKIDVIINNEIYDEYGNIHNDLNVNNQVYNLSASPSGLVKKN